MILIHTEFTYFEKPGFPGHSGKNSFERVPRALHHTYIEHIFYCSKSISHMGDIKLAHPGFIILKQIT